MLLALILIPLVTGIVVFLLPEPMDRLRKGLSFLAAAVAFAFSISLFIDRPLLWSRAGLPLLRLDGLSGLMVLASAFFGMMIIIYSFRFMAGKTGLRAYYSLLLITLSAAFGALLSDHLILLLIFWGVLGITLYLLIGLGRKSAAAAKKTMIIVGGSDALMVLGAVLAWQLTGSWNLSRIALPVGSGLEIAAFFCLLIAAFAKAGAMPFHTWVPAMAEPAPLPVVAFLPAALDKLLGIYLLARITLDLFRVGGGSWLALVLMILGAVTLTAAVMMALIQHNMKKLLAYHAVSQVGYMILGIASGIPLAIAGGLFHMVNNAVYKSCLFLTGGAVEYRTGTTELDKLGGLVKVMPITFSCFLVAALAICGVPPLNGFFSKWMIYQGLIELGAKGTGPSARLWVIWLLAAMFGSALTLASFMKVTHAVFLGEGEGREKKEVPGSMWVPMGILALLCLVFGIWALAFPLKAFIYEIVPGLSPESAWFGSWSPGPAAVLILVGLGIGWLVYKMIGLKNLRRDSIYIGGEKPLPLQNRVTGTEFYRIFTRLPVIGPVYQFARRGFFDIYDCLTAVTFFFIKLLRGLHSGILSTYLSWAVLGLLLLALLLIGLHS